jgi:hypothetical protein
MTNNPVLEEIKQHAARAFFASAWADQCEDSGNSSMISGQEIMEVMPTTIDPAAINAAQVLMEQLVKLNNNISIEQLFTTVGAIQRKTGTTGDREVTPEMFGHYCAMQAMGHGVGLHDAFGKAVYETIKVPYMEFSWHDLEKDYFKKPVRKSRADATIKRYGTVLRIYDNGGKSFDRYTIVPPRWAKEEKERNGLFNCIGSSENPFHPQGFGQHTSAMPGPHLGKRITWEQLPSDVQKFARQSFPVYAPL